MRFIALFFVLLFISGCSTRGNPAYHKQPEQDVVPKVSKTIEPSFESKEKNWITKALYKEYKKWHRTPYKYGGIDARGIDCSSLIQNVYKDAFGIDLPRTTREQVKRGYKVNRSSAKEGDIIFFKTGYNVRHAGIIVERGKFMHASEKFGVIISDLYNPYWKNRYWQTRRILP